MSMSTAAPCGRYPPAAGRAACDGSAGGVPRRGCSGGEVGAVGVAVRAARRPAKSAVVAIAGRTTLEVGGGAVADEIRDAGVTAEQLPAAEPQVRSVVACTMGHLAARDGQVRGAGERGVGSAEPTDAAGRELYEIVTARWHRSGQWGLPARLVPVDVAYCSVQPGERGRRTSRG